ISPKEKDAAISEARTEEARRNVESIIAEIGSEPVTQAEFDIVRQSLEQAPPVKFDVVRQVRVFEPYLQYVEINLRGAAIQRKRVRIPRALLRLGSSKDLEGRLRMTFDLIERDSQVSSKHLEKDLHELRRTLTRPLGKFGRVMLKAARKRFDERIKEFRKGLESHQNRVKVEIEAKLKKSRDEVVEYYLPIARASPPDELIGGSLDATNLSDDVLWKWISDQLDAVFPSADEVISEMCLDVSFKDVTFETLNDPEFIERLKEAYPDINWDKPYSDFRAMGQHEDTGKP